MAKVLVTIPPEHHPKVKAAAALQGKTIAQFCADAAVAVAVRKTGGGQ